MYLVGKGGANMVTENFTEYGGFAKNNDTKEYDLLFCASISRLLCQDRTKEEVESCNKWSNKHYDMSDIVVKERKCVTEKGDWK